MSGITYYSTTVEHILSQKNAMFPGVFYPGTSGIVSHRSTN